MNTTGKKPQDAGVPDVLSTSCIAVTYKFIESAAKPKGAGKKVPRRVKPKSKKKK
jgi:hypothetical protein